MNRVISSSASLSLALGLTMGLATVAAPARAQETMSTGPEIGSRIPDFQVQDQQGRARTFAELRGPRGLLLLFHRSADW
jgi:cytochrome oxidase Cu insertion factor (SCO1/SenC/PrrC family)